MPFPEALVKKQNTVILFRNEKKNGMDGIMNLTELVIHIPKRFSTRSVYLNVSLKKDTKLKKNSLNMFLIGLKRIIALSFITPKNLEILNIIQKLCKILCFRLFPIK